MAIQFNDNLNISAPKPLDRRYLNELSVPYSSTTEANGSISSSSRYTGLTVNINGVEYWYGAGVTDPDLVIKTGSGSGERIEKVITQASHGFSVGDVVGYSGGTYVKGLAVNDWDGEVFGVVSNSGATDKFTVVFSGYMAGLSGLGLSPSTTYFLSDTVAGDLISTEPSVEGSVIKPMLTTTTSDEALVFQYLGVSVTTGVTGGGITGGTNIGVGFGEVFKEVSGATMVFRTIVGTGGTTVETVGDTIYISGGSALKSVYTGTTTYEVEDDVDFVGTSGGTPILLPANPTIGREIEIADIEGNAFSSNIIIQGNGNNIIGATFATINTNYGAITVLWNGYHWSITSFVN